ncbi:sigma-70 family RNA polymerase sigma factor [Chloroflexi bacterium TSY]|nr:sigma-70 family RNA polymerase sigma factor [Chloroflexi bacterium TSY]
MSSYDPNFWEVSIDPEVLESVLTEPDFLESILRSPEDDQREREQEQVKQAAVTQIRELIETQLTAKQRRVVELYFYEDKTQQEIAKELGINQQVVSKHLFGVLRDGHKVGGAVKKLRKLCDKLGIDPQKWV